LSENGKHADDPAKRKAEAVRLRTEGLSLREIARRLNVSLGTVQRDTAPDTPADTPSVSDFSDTPLLGKESPISGKASETPGKASASSDKPLRERLADDLESRYDGLLKLLDDGMQATRKARVERDCPKCGCSHVDYVEIQDFKTARDIAEFFANQGFGRPGVSEGEGAGEQWTFENRVVLVANPGEEIDWEDPSVGRRSPVADDPS
jgi:Homeodomain-like domain